MKLYRRIALSLLLSAMLTGSVMAGPLARLFVSPGHVILCQGAKQQFTVYGTDSKDNIVPVTGTVTWSRTVAAGSITTGGLFTAGTTPGTYLQGVKVTAGGLTGVALIEVAPMIVSNGYILERGWGGSSPGQIAYAGGSALDAAGNVYVPEGNYIQKFDSSGNFISMFGLGLTSDIYRPRRVAIHGSYLYVVSNATIYKQDLSGNIISHFGDYGEGPGKFSYLSEIAVNSDGFLYIADFYGRVQKFDFNGNYVLEWGSAGAGDGQFDGANAIAIDSVGNVYVADVRNYRIQKFDRNGQFLCKWGTRGKENGQFEWIEDIEAGPGDIIYVSDGTSRIQKFDTSGNYLGQLQIGYGCISVDPSGNIIMAGRYKYNPSGVLLSTWGRPRDGSLSEPTGISIDSNGYLYVADCGNGDIQKFDSSGNFVSKWSAYSPSSVCVTPDQKVLVGEFTEGIEQYTTEGTLEKTWNTQYTQSFAVLPDGSLYVLDNINYQIRGYNPARNLIAQWTSLQGTNSSFDQATCIQTDGSGHIYVLDQLNRLQVFDLAGNFLRTLGTDQQICSLYFSFAPDGNIWLGGCGVPTAIISPSGELVGQFGSYGQTPGAFVYAYPMFDRDGNLYVCDRDTNRIQKFVPVKTSANSLKETKDGTTVAVSGLISTAATSEMGDCCYAEAADRSSAIKITGKSAARGKNVVAIGVLATVDGERELQASTLSVTAATVPGVVALTNKSLGGGDFKFSADSGAGQRGVEDGVGLNNIGLLVKTTGKVTVVGDEFFYIDDGTHAKDASIFNGVRVKSGRMTKPLVGQQVSITGISSITKIGDRYFRSIRPRNSNDIVKLSD